MSIRELFNFNLDLKGYKGTIDSFINDVKSKKVDILDINLLELTNQFIALFNKIKSKDLDIISKHLLSVAYLLELKSKFLIPKEEIKEFNEETDELLESEELREKLLEYKKFKDLTSVLKIRKADSEKLLSKSYTNINIKEKDLRILKKQKINYIDIEELSMIFKNLLKNMNFNENNFDLAKMKNEYINPHELEPKVIEFLELKENNKALFSDIIKKIGLNILMVVVLFLSVLNLAKNNKINLNQKENDIEVNLINYKE